MPCRLLLVDDYPALARGLAALVGQEADLTVAGQFASGEALLAFLEVAPVLPAEVLLLGLHLLPPHDGLRLRIGLALTDLGAIAYNNSQRVRQGQLANTCTVRLGQLDALKFSGLHSVENTAQRLAGLSIMGPLVVGSDNLGGLLSVKTATGADVYFGLALALHRHRRPDRAGDGMSNAYDKCPKERGAWATRGCAPVPAPLIEVVPSPAPAQAAPMQAAQAAVAPAAPAQAPAPR